MVTARSDGGVDRIGYAALMDRALGVSGVLAEMGVTAGDRVATLAWNSRAHVEVWYAVMGMGAVCHTLNPRLTAPQLADMSRQSGAWVIVASADLLALARDVAAEVGARVLVIDGEGEDALEPLIAAAPRDVAWGDFPEPAPSGLCFTSGTTGAPKGVTYTHRSSFLHTLRALQADVMAFTADDAVLAVVPMFHANAWGLPFALPAVGGRLVLRQQVDGASLARLIVAAGVTVGVGVPTVWLGLLDHVEAAGIDLPSLTRIIVGGAPMARADGADRGAPRRHGPDELGHDRAVAAGRHRAPDDPHDGRCGPGGPRSASTCS
ncbi:AMP-binding protein [Sphingomonas sp. MMS24-JH45]